MSAASDPRSATLARLELVAELAFLINSTFDLDQIFREAIQRLRHVLAFRRASVVLVATDGASYYLHTLFDAARGGFQTIPTAFPITEGLTGQVIRSGTAIRADDYAGIGDIHHEGEQSVSVLIIPLLVGGEVIGTLNFGAATSTPYDDDDLALATLLGRQISTSLHYSKLLATIEEQRRALATEHAAVSRSRNRLEALLEASDAAILMVSGDTIVHANRAMGELVGRPRELLDGARLSQVNELLSRALRDRQALVPQTDALLSGDTMLQDLVEFRIPVGRVCQRTVAAVRDESDALLGHVLIYRDVTREVQAERAKDEFVSIVSHELRTPLTSVKTSLGLLSKGLAGTLTDQARELLDIALRNLERLIRLVDDLLDLARIQSGRFVTQLGPVSVSRVAAEAIEAVRGFAQERGVRLEYADEASPAAVLADADRLEQVLVNLLANAIKFSPEDGVVSLRWWPDRERIAFEVADEGPGIPAEQIDSIFGKFTQLERSDVRSHGGAGLGLSISRAIVEQFDGEIWAENREPRGARFLVRLRRARETPAAAVDDEPPLGAPSFRTILLVETDRDRLRLRQQLFESVGWAVTTAEDGAAALRAVADRSFDLIAVNTELADMHGLELLRRLRGSPPATDIPSLLIGPGVRHDQAVAYGADACVTDDAETLTAAANRLLTAPPRRIVLLVEDDPAVRDVLARALRSANLGCLEAAGGEEALELARARIPDVVITDWHLPQLDGVAVLQALRADSRLAQVPAMLVTGYGLPTSGELASSLGAKLVRKPFDVFELVEEIKQLVGS